MSIFLMGFLALVLIPALILSVVIRRLISVPQESPFRDDQARFTLSMEFSPLEEGDYLKKRI